MPNTIILTCVAYIHDNALFKLFSEIHQRPRVQVAKVGYTIGHVVRSKQEIHNCIR